MASRLAAGCARCCRCSTSCGESWPVATTHLDATSPERKQLFTHAPLASASRHPLFPYPLTLS